MILFMRNAYIEKVDSLVYLIRYLSQNSFDILIVSVKNDNYLSPSFISERIKYKSIEPSQDQSFLKVPTTVRMGVEGLKLMFKFKPDVVIGADQKGTIIGQLLAKLYRVPFVYYSLEYPNRMNDSKKISDQLERNAIRHSVMGITFDDEHARFISKEAGLDIKRFSYLPNGSGPRKENNKTGILRSELGLGKEDVIVLHSGGFGQWFNSLELATAAENWPAYVKLVFHTSHHVEKEDYTGNFMNQVTSGNVILHSKPVPFDKLDSLIASADIGIATYNLPLLSFRAEKLGMAAGKIGRYLKNGLPVIVENIPTIRGFIDRYKCGICVDDYKQIGSAIETIMGNYDVYRKNAFQCYDELWDPDPYCKGITSRIVNLLK